MRSSHTADRAKLGAVEKLKYCFLVHSFVEDAKITNKTSSDEMWHQVFVGQVLMPLAGVALKGSFDWKRNVLMSLRAANGEHQTIAMWKRQPHRLTCTFRIATSAVPRTSVLVFHRLLWTQQPGRGSFPRFAHQHCGRWLYGSIQQCRQILPWPSVKRQSKFHHWKHQTAH